jgi:hypothetical protein
MGMGTTKNNRFHAMVSFVTRRTPDLLMAAFNEPFEDYKNVIVIKQAFK